jgi:hypothetical protein
MMAPGQRVASAQGLVGTKPAPSLFSVAPTRLLRSWLAGPQAWRRSDGTVQEPAVHP